MGNRSEHRNEGMIRWPRWGRAVVMAAAMVLAPMAAVAEQDCAPDRVTLRGDWGTATFRVEIADDAAERAQGLMYRDQMDRGAGMLFVYPRPQVVQRIAREAVPFDETPLPGGSGIQYVLEINGGLAERFGIGPGTEIRHPAIGEDAAWTC